MASRQTATSVSSAYASKADHRLHSHPMVGLRADEPHAPTEQPQRARNGHGTAQRQTAYDLLDSLHPPAARPVAPNPRRKLRPFHPHIVQFIYRQRLALSTHVHERFPQWMGTLRTAQRHLWYLRTRGYIAILRVRDRALKRFHIYHVTAKGLKLIRATFPRRGTHSTQPAEEHERRGRGGASTVHDLIVAQFALDTRLTVRARTDLALPFTELRWFQSNRRLRLGPAQGGRSLEPDCGFMLSRQSPDGSVRFLWHFAEIDLGTRKVSDLREQLRYYASWWDERGRERWLPALYQAWHAPQQRPELRLLYVAHDRRAGRDGYRVRDLLILALDELPRDLRRFTLITTLTALYAHRHDRSPLMAPVWLRVRDFHPYLAAHQNPFHVDYRRRSRELEPGSRRLAFQRRFMDWVLEQPLPKYTLLPPPIVGAPALQDHATHSIATSQVF